MKQRRATKSMGIIALAMAFLVLAVEVKAADPDLLTDFDAPAERFPEEVNGYFFTFKGFRGLADRTGIASGSFKATKASVAEFEALSGLGVSYALLEFGPDSVNPPHTHPRGSELMMVLDGSLTVAFVDTTNKLFKQTLFKGDLFVFPKGLVHYQINSDKSKSAKALVAFGTVNPGTVSLPSTLFGSGISDPVLANSFMVSPQTLADLRAPFL